MPDLPDDRDELREMCVQAGVPYSSKDSVERIKNRLRKVAPAAAPTPAAPTCPTTATSSGKCASRRAYLIAPSDSVERIKNRLRKVAPAAAPTPAAPTPALGAACAAARR